MTMTIRKHHCGRVKPFYIILLFILLLLGSGFYWLAGAVNQQQDAIADWVSDKLGHEVEIDQARLSWVNLSPKLELVTVKILAEDDATHLLSLEKLYLDLDLYDSIRYRDLRLDDVTLTGLKIGVVRDSKGLIALQGLNQQSDSTPLFAELLVRSNALNSVHLKSITVDFTDQTKTFLTGRYYIDSAVIEHQLNKWQTKGKITLPDALGDDVQFSANWLLNEKQPQLTTWQWAVEANELHLTPLKNDLTFRNVIIEQGRVDATLSGEGVGARLNKAQMVLDLTNCQLANRQNKTDILPVIIEHLSGQFEWLHFEQGWMLTASNLYLDTNDKAWPKSSLTLTQQGEGVEAKGDFLRIEDLTNILGLSGELPEQLVAQRPKGDIKNYQFFYAPNSGLDIAQFQLVDGELSAWRDYPGIDNLNLNVNMAGKAAQIKLNSQRVTVAPATWLKNPVFFDDITGELAFQLEPEQQQWQMQANQLNIRNSDLTLLLDGNVVKTAEGKIVNDLTLIMNDVAVAHWKSYFPERILSKNFKQWANKAFLAGKIKHGEIRLKGDLAAFPYESQQDKTLGEFKMALDLEGVQLHYANSWPDLFDVAGQITGQGNNLNIRSQQGAIAGFAFKDVTVNIESLTESNPILTVTGGLAGTTQKALNFLQNSPLKKRFGSVAKAVSAKGNSYINLSLVVPLADSDNTEVSGDVSFINAHLYKKTMPELAIEQVQGRLDFNNNGVTANKLTGQFLGQAVDVTVFPKNNATVIAANGTISSQQLAKTWPEKMPDFIQGNAPYQLEVLVSEREIGDFYTDVTLKSDMKGMAVTLPEPLMKSNDQIKNLKVVFHQSAKIPRYNLSYDNQFNLAVIPDQQGEAAFVEASLPELNVDKWSSWLEQRKPQGESPLSTVATLTLTTDKLIGFGQQFSAVKVTAQQQKKSWQATITSPEISGIVSIPEVVSNNNKLKVDLDKLILTLPQETNSIEKSQSALWPAMVLNIADLSIGGKRLGSFELDSNSENNAWVIDQGQLNSPVYQASITKGRWSKLATGEKTELSIKAESSDFAGLLEKFGYQAAIEAKESKLNIALSWSGGPLAVSAQTLNGSLGFKLKKGKLNEVEPGAAGRVFGLMSIAAVPRRLALDFNELFGKGLNFKAIRADFSIADGQAITDNFKLEGEAAEIEIKGPIDLVAQQYNQTVKVRPNVSSTLPLAGAVAGGPIGLGVGTAILLADKLAGKLFDKNIVNLVSYNYKLTGAWQDPQLQSVGVALPQL
jgi:uncharacterized protein (TIGR02099 family)